MIPNSLFVAVGEAMEAARRQKDAGLLPQSKKARALPRTPWEKRLGDLSEVLAWRKDFSFRAKKIKGDKYPHINVLELRGRGMIARRLARRVCTHSSRVIALGDSRVALERRRRGRAGVGG